jgi:hypothetical protein
MAIYKSAAGNPASAQRIDGAVWDAAGPGARIRGWGYPTFHASDQFKRFNSIVRVNDEAWSQCSAAEQAAWDQYGIDRKTWWAMICGLRRRWYNYFPLMGDEAFKVINTSRAFCGLPPTTLPPDVPEDPAGYSLTFSQDWNSPAPQAPLQSHFRATLSGPARRLSATHQLQFYTSATGLGSAIKQDTHKLTAAG